MTQPPDAAELQRLGIYDPDAPNADDRLRIIQRAFEMGATVEELEEAVTTANLGDLLLDLAVRPPGSTQTLDQFAEASNNPDLVRSFWRALGLPASGPVRVTPDIAAGLELLTAASEWFTPETALALARVVGSASARVAESIVSSFRVDVEAPRQALGDRYSDVVDEYTGAARELLPLFLETVNAAIRRHMVLVSYQLWSTDEDRTAVTQEWCVGFADLVGSTEALRAGSVAAMADTVRQFEELIWDLVTNAGGRVVKLIGDEAMFVVVDPVAACRVALDLLDLSPHPIRVGIAHGTVAALYGDYYGATVNLASRLVDVAHPSSVAASESVRVLVEGRDDGMAFDDLGERSLKGFDGPVPIHCLRRAR